MNETLRKVIEASSMADDARVWERQHPVHVLNVGDGRFLAFGCGPHGDVPAPWQAAAYVLAAFAHDYVVYPTGAVVPFTRVNWFWEYEHEVRQGSCEQAVRYATKRGADPLAVFPVSPDRIHGVYVRYEERDSDAYRLVHARPFPTWCW